MHPPSLCIQCQYPPAFHLGFLVTSVSREGSSASTFRAVRAVREPFESRSRAVREPLESRKSRAVGEGSLSSAPTFSRPPSSHDA